MSMENDGRHIVNAMERTSCKKHDAPKGVPCWTLSKNVKGGFGRYAAICGTRIRKAGYNGQISPSSMQRSPARPSFEKGPIARVKNSFANRAASPTSKFAKLVVSAN